MFELANGLRSNKINLFSPYSVSFIRIVLDRGFRIYSETKSILTDGDWKKLWMEAGNSNANLKKDNSIDSSDSPIFDDTEVSAKIHSIKYIFIYKHKHKHT